MEKDRKFVIFLALCFTFGIMFFGLLFGLLINNYQTDSINKELLDLKVRNQEVTLFSYILQNDLGKSDLDCNFYSNSLDNFAVYLNEYGRIVEKYFRNAENLEEVKSMQKDYVVATLNLYFSIDKYNQVCKANAKDTILYLYPYDCGVCDGITKTINNMVYNLNGPLSFSIPTDIGLESVEFIKDYYDINVIPSVVVNGNPLEGPESYTEIEKYLIKKQ